MTSPQSFISPAALAARLGGVSRTTLWREVKRKNLPEPIRVTPGRIGWPAEEIDAVLAQRVQARRSAL